MTLHDETLDLVNEHNQRLEETLHSLETLEARNRELARILEQMVDLRDRNRDLVDLVERLADTIPSPDTDDWAGTLAEDLLVCRRLLMAAGWLTANGTVTRPSR